MNNVAENTEMSHTMIPPAPMKRQSRELTAREKKINKLKQKIASGKYRVSNADLAKALILSL